MTWDDIAEKVNNGEWSIRIKSVRPHTNIWNGPQTVLFEFLEKDGELAAFTEVVIVIPADAIRAGLGFLHD